MRITLPKPVGDSDSSKFNTELPTTALNEEFGWPNERFGTYFEVLFKGNDFGYVALKSTSKIQSQTFVRPSNIVVW